MLQEIRMKVFLSQGREGREKKKDGTKGRRWRGRGAGEFARRTPAARGPQPQSAPEGEVEAGARALHGPPGGGERGMEGYGVGGEEEKRLLAQDPLPAPR